MAMILPFASNFPDNDLFSLSKDHPRWTHLEIHYVKRVRYSTSESILGVFNTYVDYVQVGLGRLPISCTLPLW